MLNGKNAKANGRLQGQVTVLPAILSRTPNMQKQKVTQERHKSVTFRS